MKHMMYSVLLGLGVALLTASRGAAYSEELPDPAGVVKRVIERTQDSARKEAARKYVYQKRSQVEELDSSGKVSESTKKEYQVVLIDGARFSRLVRIQDRELTPAELDEEKRREDAFRKKVASKPVARKARADEDGHVAELASHYDFTTERREYIGNRPVLVLSFRPKKEHGEEKTMEEKILHNFTGKVWVDEQEAEIVRLKVGLVESMSLGLFGMVGGVKQCDFGVENTRVAEGVWLKAKQTVYIVGRKVLSPMRYRSIEEEFDFKLWSGDGSRR